MRKDFTRDYVIAAFRLYASLGRPTYEEVKRAVYQKALDDHKLKDPEAANVAAEAAVENASPLLLDILAVEKMIDILLQGNKAYIVKAVNDVYFASPQKPLCRGDIAARVKHSSITIPASERSVFLWLKEARLLFAALRGLRLHDANAKKYKFAVVKHQRVI